MKNYFKYSILITLTLLMATSLVNAQKVPIGSADQAEPYESIPTVATPSTLDTSDFTAAMDGNLGTSVGFKGATSTTTTGNVVFSGFKTPATAPFTIAWVDIKIKYKYPGTSTNGYRIEYLTSGTTWTPGNLQAAVSGASAKFDRDGVAQVRPWTNLKTVPGGLAFSWTDVGSLKVRIFITRGATAAWSDAFDLFEIWLTVYSTVPPSSSTALSVMPATPIMGVIAGRYFFVDVYINGLSGSPGLWGYQVCIKYDPNIITGVDWFTYWPFGSPKPSSVGPDYVSVSYMTFDGDTVGFTGTNTPLCRIYFKAKAGGVTPLDLIDQRPTYITEIKPVGVEGYVPPLYDSWFSSPRYLSTEPPTVLNLAPPFNPTGTNWKEIFPTYPQPWSLTGWTDNGDNTLSVSDQVGMKNETMWIYYFRVDRVTITIHWAFKSPDTGTGAAEPETPVIEMPSGSPFKSVWHMILPTFSRMINISSWTDTDSNGKFSVSDEFTFFYTPYDVVLVGSAPVKGVALHAAGSTNLYYDADTNNKWDIGEPAINDTDGDYMYTPASEGGTDYVLVGPEPDPYVSLSPPSALDKFYDANSNGIWDIGEPAIRDADASGTYTPQEFHSGTLSAVSTDILVTQTPTPPTPPEPEFPLGVGIVTLIAPMIAIIYVWRTRKRKVR